ncbi:MAG: WD40 repeat domain-containing protein [Pseudomonadota bacterium]
MATPYDGIHALQSRLFAALAMEALAYDPERSLLLGMQALDATLRHDEPTEFAADEALREALWRSRLRRALRYDAADGSPSCAAWNHDGTRLVVGSKLGPIVLWDAASGERVWTSGASRPSYCIAWSPDGTRIAVGGLGKDVVVLNAADGTLLKTIATNGGTGLAFGPDGRRLAIQTLDTGGVWDIETGARLFALGGASLANLAWSPDGTRIATCTQGIRLWDAETGASLSSLGPERDVLSVDWSPDGTRLAAGCRTHCEVWDIASGTQRMTTGAFALSGGIATWSPDGARLAKRGEGDTATIHAADDGRVLLTLRGQFADDGFYALPHGISLAWHPDGTRLAIGPGTNGPPLGTVAASGDTDARRTAYRSVKIWDVRPDDLFDGDLCLASVQPHTVLDAAWSPDGGRIAISTEDAVVVLDADSGLPWRRFPSQADDDTHALHWSPDGVWLATSDIAPSGDPHRITRLWHVADGEALTTLPAAAPLAVGALRLPSWSADGQRLAALAGDGRLHAWDMRTRQHVSSFEDGSGVTRLALSPDGTRLATSTLDDAAIRILDVESGHVSIVLGSTVPFDGTENARYHFAVDGLAWSPDGRRLVAIAIDAVTTWDIASGAPVATFANVKGYPDLSVRSYPDEKYFEFTTDRSRLVLLAIFGTQTTHGVVGIPAGGTVAAFRDTESGQSLPEPDFMRFENFMVRKDLRPNVIRWRPDGRQSASAMQMSNRLYDGPQRSAWGDIDRSVRVTDTATGREALAVGRVEIDGMAWRPDGKRLACWRGNRLEIHPTDPHELMALARTRVTRNFTFDECLRYFHGEDPPPIP